MTRAIPASGEVIYDDGLLRICRIQPPRIGLVLTGEADETRYEPLVAALAQVIGSDGTGAANVHMDLSSLEFCDAAALHAMIAPAEDGGRPIVLHRPPAPLRALIRIAGWDQLPWLKVVTGQ